MSCSHHNHGACVTTALGHAEAHCQKNGLRFTPPRRKVFELLWGSHKAMTAAEIMHIVGKDQPPSTYRALEFLTEQKLVHYIASLNAYIGCTHPETPHVSQLFICETCREVTETSSDEAFTALNEAAANAGFTIRQTFIEVLGTCPNCSQTA